MTTTSAHDSAQNDDHDTFRTEIAERHTEHLTGYRALLARIESAAASAQVETDEVSGSPNTTSQFTDDIRFLIALSEEIVNKFRPHPQGEPAIAPHDSPREESR